ncbi:hypothetical protein [Paracoccus sediminis]|uniref:Glyceraldehyde-3-phosphate dehydrogenase n=1 Tax=Paracoccus sediminis TaxID=1214787 RepID=A0A238XAM7_9RHOB|nr:hypothetical protein [Paracoccus sediminis]SNR56096.1 hypothetical protein SAMN06265378_10928 [Paracoccus sediminis]
MTNTLTIALLVVILGLFAADQIWLQWQIPLLAARMVDGLVEYLSFWR